VGARPDGDVAPGGAVTLPGVGLPVVSPAFPVGDIVLAPAGELLVFTGTQGSAAGGRGAGAGMIGETFAGLPVDVGCAGAVVDGV
jgi:hypothetical protein